MAYAVPDQYDWTIKIDSYMVGPEWTLRPAYQLKLQQEVGERHFATGGLGYETLMQEGLVFVLTRLQTAILRAPRLNETVRLQTWHRQSVGAQFFRCYRFLSEQGDPLIESVSAFTLVDPVEHKLLRPTAFDRFDVVGQSHTVTHCADPARLRLPADMPLVGTHTIRRSEIDFNGHLNNTEYAELLCDYAPGGMNGRCVTGFSIGYRRESREGQALHLFACDDGAAVWMRGDRDDGACFDAKMTYTRCM